MERSSWRSRSAARMASSCAWVMRPCSCQRRRSASVNVIGGGVAAPPFDQPSFDWMLVPPPFHVKVGFTAGPSWLLYSEPLLPANTLVWFMVAMGLGYTGSVLARCRVGPTGRAPPTYVAMTFSGGNLRAYLREPLSSPPRPPAAAESSGGKCFPSTKIVADRTRWVGQASRTYAIPRSAASSRSGVWCILMPPVLTAGEAGAILASAGW
jgi:hypothetical protein